MPRNYKNQARRELNLALRAELQARADQLIAKVKDPSLKVGERHRAQTEWYQVSGELATINRKLKAAARAKRNRKSGGGSLLGILGLK